MVRLRRTVLRQCMSLAFPPDRAGKHRRGAPARTLEDRRVTRASANCLSDRPRRPPRVAMSVGWTASARRRGGPSRPIRRSADGRAVRCARSITRQCRTSSAASSRGCKTVLMVTHDMAEAMALADRIGVLDAGRLIWSGPANAIVQADDERVRQLLEAVTIAPPSSRDRRS